MEVGRDRSWDEAHVLVFLDAVAGTIMLETSFHMNAIYRACGI